MSLCCCDPDKEFNFGCFAHGANEQNRKEFIDLKQKYNNLRQAAIALRQAQKAYMSNRGNQELGKQVAVKARELDQVLGD